MDYRKPTPKQQANLDASRRLMQQGIAAEKDPLSPMFAKQGRDDIARAKRMFEGTPESVRAYEAYNQAGYSGGGSVRGKSASSRADGIAQRGKTRGTMI
jgi:hypothetical protein